MNASLEEIASLYVLDQLPTRDRAAFESRLVRDPELTALVRELESALAHRIRALPSREPSADALARIEARIDALPAARSRDSDRDELTPVSARDRSRGWTAPARWGLAAAVAFGLVTFAVHSLLRGLAAPVVIFVGLDAQRSTVASLPLAPRTQDADARFIQLASLAEQFWEKPDRLPVTLPADGASGDRGYALFDPASHQGFIAIEQLPAPAPNERYHLWIVDTASGRVHDAGILPLADARAGLFSFSVAPEEFARSAHLNFFVTAEKAAMPAPPRPRGEVVLGDRRI
jgi:anti-sigma-K factor RskA